MKIPEKQIILFLVILPLFSFTQSLNDLKRDYIWMFGYENHPPDWGGSKVDFKSQPPAISYTYLSIYLSSANSSISDTGGNLLFYTNGMYISNRNHLVMPNGDSINPGFFFDYYEGYGYREPQAVITLPLPGSNNLYYIIHQKIDFYDPDWFAGTELMYSIVDMNLDGGLGDVTQKNILVLADTLEPGCITATRHANGRDWWILIPEFGRNRYYRYLLSPQGITLIGIQSIGTASTVPELGQVCFSPDGTKYVRIGAGYVSDPFRLEVFDFNRCSGLLSNYRNLWYPDSAYAEGIAISPDSRYMYVSPQKRLDQYDLHAPDITASRQVIGVYDGFIDPLFWLGRTYFFLAQLAPDRKIYICTQNSTQYLHVINHPDSAGTACDFQQHSLHLNTFNAHSIPNFPNFRLGPVDCSVCDTLGIDVVNGSTLTGKVKYHDASHTALNSCKVFLRTPGGYALDSCITDENYEFRFCGRLPGTFKLTATTIKPWGGVNNIDALLILKHFAALSPLNGLHLKAADVNATSTVNAADAFLVQKRFVGLSSSFPAGDWVFEEPQVAITGQSVQTIDISALCTGDVNASYIPQPFTNCGDTLLDMRDLQKYATVQIGSQCWLKGNLNTGSMILHNQLPANNATIEKYCYNDDPANCAVYGGLYRWDEMMQYSTSIPAQGICPQGWHIPSDTEWCVLGAYLDNSFTCIEGFLGTTIGGKLKESGTTHWNPPNTGATNASKYTALGTGILGLNATFSNFLNWTAFWSATQTGGSNGFRWLLTSSSAKIHHYHFPKSYGLSVRCLMD